MPKMLSQATIDLAVKLLKGDAYFSIQQIAEEAGCSPATISNIRKRLANGDTLKRTYARPAKANPKPAPIPAPACPPPSRAMLALAEFDPVIARAARQRLLGTPDALE